MGPEDNLRHRPAKDVEGVDSCGLPKASFDGSKESERKRNDRQSVRDECMNRLCKEHLRESPKAGVLSVKINTSLVP